jgi:hypothetical protein
MPALQGKRIGAGVPRISDLRCVGARASRMAARWFGLARRIRHWR